MNMATEKSKIPTNANPSLAGTSVWVIPPEVWSVQLLLIVLGSVNVWIQAKKQKNPIDLAEETSANGFHCELLLLLSWKVAWWRELPDS